MKQQTPAGLEKQGKTTLRALLLADMNRIIPWPEQGAAVQTAYPKVSEHGGRPPIPLERMLRIYVSAAVVQPVGPGSGGSAVRRGGNARLCRH